MTRRVIFTGRHARQHFMLNHLANVTKSIWGHSDETYSRTLDTHMKRLRKKLGDRGDWIETVRGAGYRIVEFMGQPLSA